MKAADGFPFDAPVARAQDKVTMRSGGNRVTSKHAGIALGALGFGLCKTAISVAYITAMGLGVLYCRIRVRA